MNKIEIKDGSIIREVDSCHSLLLFRALYALLHVFSIVKLAVLELQLHLRWLHHSVRNFRRATEASFVLLPLCRAAIHDGDVSPHVHLLELSRQIAETQLLRVLLPRTHLKTDIVKRIAACFEFVSTSAALSVAPLGSLVYYIQFLSV